MDIDLNKIQNKHIDPIMLHKMAFLYNALENGWCIKKKNNSYVFASPAEKDTFGQQALNINSKEYRSV